MPGVRCRKHGASHPFRVVPLVSFCALILSVPAYADDTATLHLVRNVHSIQSQHGVFAPELLTPLVDLGELYSARECNHALDVLHLALEVSRRDAGLLNAQQLEIYPPLLNCYVTLDRPTELARAQHYVMLINQAQYGKADPRLLPALEQAAARYEEAGLYFSARRAHHRALEIARATAGDKDFSLVAPLRGLARAYRLEYAYGLALPDITDDAYLVSTLRSNADNGSGKFPFDRLGELSLERAVAILRKHPEARPERVDTLLELGDWHQLAGHYRDALNAYREAWDEIHADDTPETVPLATAMPLLFRTQSGFARRRAPFDEEGLRRYTVDFDYTVTRDGRVEDVEVIESNAPPHVEYRVLQDLRQQRHRPKFVNGEPVEERGVLYRRDVYARPPERETAALNETSR